MRLSPTIVRTASHSAHPAPAASGSSKTAFLVSPPMSGIPSKQRDSGYTLVEVLVAMTVVSILAAIAIPSFKYVTTSNRITTEVNDSARRHAIRPCRSHQGRPVGHRLRGEQHLLGLRRVTSWHNGWIVFMDLNGDGAMAGGRNHPADPEGLHRRRYLCRRPGRPPASPSIAWAMANTHAAVDYHDQAARFHRNGGVDTLPRHHSGRHDNHAESRSCAGKLHMNSHCKNGTIFPGIQPHRGHGGAGRLFDRHAGPRQDGVAGPVQHQRRQLARSRGHAGVEHGGRHARQSRLLVAADGAGDDHRRRYACQ